MVQAWVALEQRVRLVMVLLAGLAVCAAWNLTTIDGPQPVVARVANIVLNVFWWWVVVWSVDQFLQGRYERREL